MAKYYCILFDADNTLLNFDAAESKALAETLVNYGIEPDAETVQTYRTINEELWRQLEKGQIRREKLLNERFSRFLKAIDAALRALGVENREHVLMVGDSLTSDIQGGANAGLDTCWFNPNHTENPGKVIPTYEIASLEELYPLVMEQDELANVGQKNRRHQC